MLSIASGQPLAVPCPIALTRTAPLTLTFALSFALSLTGSTGVVLDVSGTVCARHFALGAFHRLLGTGLGLLIRLLLRFALCGLSGLPEIRRRR